MIHTESEYRSEVTRLANQHRQLAEQRERLRQSGLTDAQIDQATRESTRDCQQVEAEIAAYERRNAPTWVPAFNSEDFAAP